MTLLFALLFLPALGTAEIINFDSAQPGPVPQGWTVAMTHTGGAPKWEVLNDPSAPTEAISASGFSFYAHLHLRSGRICMERPRSQTENIFTVKSRTARSQPRSCSKGTR